MTGIGPLWPSMQKMEMAYGICDENGMVSGSNEKELWSIDWNAQSL